MMKYATAYDGSRMARALGGSLPLSAKKSVEVCSFIRGRELSGAIRLLESVADGKVAVPFRRYAHGGTGHRPGIGPGRYPVNVCLALVKLLKQVRANATNKGLDSERLVISGIVAKKAAMSYHYGRQRGRRMKRTHIEVVVAEAQKQPKAGVK